MNTESSRNHSPHETFRSFETGVMFVLNLEIGNGSMDRIIFREESVAAELALDFCQRHSLGIDFYDHIVAALEDRRQEVIQNRELSVRKINSEIDRENRKKLSGNASYKYQAAQNNGEVSAFESNNHGGSSITSGFEMAKRTNRSNQWEKNRGK